MAIDYAHVPVVPPPPGVTSNFVNPESRAKYYVAIIATCLPLMLPIVVMRLYLRLWNSRSFAVDDAACILATIGTVAYAAVKWTLTSVIGRHFWDVPVSDFTEEAIRREAITAMAYGPTIFFAKLSLFWLYLRLFAPNRQTRYLTYVGIGSTFAVYTATTAYLGYSCIPRPGQSWLERTRSACGQGLTLAYIQGVFGVASDIYLFVLPIPVLWQLQVPLRKKIGVFVIFASGLLACVASMLGLYYRLQTYHGTDYTWAMLPVEVLLIVELSVGVMCGCMPHLVSFFRHRRVKSVFAFLKRVSSRITSKVSNSKRSLSSEKSDSIEHKNFDPVSSSPSNEYYIETQVLGSVQGEGKFLKSGDHAQRDSTWRGSNSGLSTRREAWD